MRGAPCGERGGLYPIMRATHNNSLQQFVEPSAPEPSHRRNLCSEARNGAGPASTPTCGGKTGPAGLDPDQLASARRRRERMPARSSVPTVIEIGFPLES